MKVLLPDSLPLNPNIPDADLVTYAIGEPIPPAHRDAEVLVVWDVPIPMLRRDARDLANLKFVQGLAAGADMLVAAGFAPQVVCASGVGLHTLTVTEHALALLLSLVRRLPQAAAAQMDHVWSGELAGSQPLHPGRPITTLIDAHVVIWGFGHIGVNLAKVLSALGARVSGIARHAGVREGFEVVTDDELDEVLADADVLIMVLPATADTRGALTAARLAGLPRGALLVNVGRGSTVDEDALLAALASGQLGGAALDVFATEPLPPDSPLWDAPHLLITPHCAGGRPVGADELISANVQAWRAGGPIRNLVER